MRKSIKENVKWALITAFFLWVVVLWAVGWEYFLPSATVVLVCTIFSAILYHLIPEKYAFPIVGLTWITLGLCASSMPHPWSHCMGVTMTGFLIGSRIYLIRKELKHQATQHKKKQQKKNL